MVQHFLNFFYLHLKVAENAILEKGRKN